MSFLYRILYAAHANGSHHKLAMRALDALEGPRSDDWRALFLSHAEGYLTGSKAPDAVFKDFQNHVLHVGDGDWGGAREAAREWYDRTVDALRAGAWADACFAAGVMSHYLTDPLMPLHTGSSEAETHVHRACEWSASRAFEELWELTPEITAGEIEATLPAGADWLERMLREGAVEAHAEYGSLIAHYNLERGVSDPPSGLDAEARALLAPLLARCVATVAVALDRAFVEARATPPKTSLTAATVLAGVKAPVRWVTARLQDAADRREVIRIHEELKSSGRLEINLPEEQRSVRALAAARPPVRKAERSGAGRRVEAPRLERVDPVERAPSIGPKTAARLAVIGVRTVGDLIDADPARVAEALGDRHYSAHVIAVWRDQAALLTRLPRLKSAQAVMLVAAGYRDVAVIAQAERNPLIDALVSASADAEIRRATWNAAPPDPRAVERIIETARAALAAA